MPNNQSSSDLFSLLLSGITKTPRHFLLFLLLVLGLMMSLPVVLMGLLVLGVLFFTRWPWWIIGVVGVSSVSLAWLMDGISPLLLAHWNGQLISAIGSGQFTFSQLTLYHGFAALPYGLVWGALARLILQWQSPLERELKRVGRGRVRKPHQLSPRRLTKRLHAIQQATYDQGSILGVNQQTGELVTLSDQDANLHTLAVATTGAGKTTVLLNIIESVMTRQLPLCYVDGKGDLALAQRIEAYAKKIGRPFYLFSMVGESVHYNPIASGGFTSKKDRIVQLRHWSEDHYRIIAEGYLQTVFKVLDRCEIHIDLHTLAQYLTPEALMLLVRPLKDKALMQEVVALNDKKNDIASLIGEIENMAHSEIGRLFDCAGHPVFTLDKLISENAVVYFCLQPLAFPAYAETLGKLIINDLKALAASLLTQQKRMKLYTIFDEFSVFAGDQIINLINQGRGAGIHAILSTQSLSDILRKGDQALLGQVLNNTNNYLIGRQNNPDDADILANIIGTKTQFEVTSQLQAEQRQASVGSIREVESFNIHPNTIKQLGMGEGIVVNKQRFMVQSVKFRQGAI